MRLIPWNIIHTFHNLPEFPAYGILILLQNVTQDYWADAMQLNALIQPSVPRPHSHIKLYQGPIDRQI